MKNIKKIQRKSAEKKSDKKIRSELKEIGRKAVSGCPELQA